MVENSRDVNSGDVNSRDVNSVDVNSKRSEISQVQEYKLLKMR